ncbi:MAG TPA: LuxR C-terminal-related transcriptional regulator, partial [Gaiellales bacterium]
GSVEPGVEYFLQRLHPDDRERVRALVARVVADPVALLDIDLHFDYRFVLADGSLREMQARGRVEQDGDGRPTRFVGASQDVTGQRLSERELQAHYAIGQALRDWESFDEGIVRLLQRLGSALEFAIGTLWVHDRGLDCLRCRAYWSAPGVALDPFEDASWKAEVRPGVGIPGLAWATELPVVTDRLDGDGFQRSGEIARQAGLRSGVALPALGEDGPVVVLAFYSFDRIEPREQLERTLIGIGRELGRFLESHRVDLGPPLLSPRELEVLTLAADGLSGPDIARRLFLAPSTVKTHFEKIYDKLGVGDRSAAVAYGLRFGLFK